MLAFVARNPYMNEKKLVRLKNARETQRGNDFYRDLSERRVGKILESVSARPVFTSSFPFVVRLCV